MGFRFTGQTAAAAVTVTVRGEVHVTVRGEVHGKQQAICMCSRWEIPQVARLACWALFKSLLTSAADADTLPCVL